MEKKSKNEKELENIINKKENEYNLKLIYEKNVKKKFNEIEFLNKKRENPEKNLNFNNQNDENKNNNNNNNNDNKINNNNSEINIIETINKIFNFAEKNESLNKCINILNKLVKKICDDKNYKLENKIIYLTYLLNKLELFDIKFENEIDLFDEFEKLFKDIEQKIIISDDKKFNVLKCYKIYFIHQKNLFKNDYFLFNSSYKIIMKIFENLPDYNNNEKEILENFNNNNSKEFNFDINLEIALKRKIIFHIFLNLNSFNFQINNIKSDIKILYKNLMTIYISKLSEDMIKLLKININNKIDKNNKKINLINYHDNKLNNPLENYYETTDARDLKYIAGGYMDTWVFKQCNN
jgi:hypothetical protein